MCKSSWAKCAKPAVWLWLALPCWAAAQATQADAAAQALHTRALAASCTQCHGTDGQAPADALIPSLAGRPEAELLAQLLAFRSGQRPATLMQQLTRGYTPEQLQQLAHYFSTRSQP
jgi:sulfide dehydrogenase cytochrome subunit